MKDQIPKWDEYRKFFELVFDPKENVSYGFVPGSTPIQELPSVLDSLVENLDLIDEWLSF